jgi:hypothetical protein
LIYASLASFVFLKKITKEINLKTLICATLPYFKLLSKCFQKFPNKTLWSFYWYLEVPWILSIFFRNCGCQLNFKTTALIRKQEKYIIGK